MVKEVIEEVIEAWQANLNTGESMNETVSEMREISIGAIWSSNLGKTSKSTSLLNWEVFLRRMATIFFDEYFPFSYKGT